MDITLDKTTRRIRSAKSIGKIAAVVAGLIVAGLIIRHLLSPGLNSKRIRTAVVEKGHVESIISATGNVVPEFEHVISCPFDTKILEVLEEPGISLSPGHAVLRLDEREIVERITKLEDEILLKNNEIERSKLELAKLLADLKSEVEIITLRIEYLSAKTKQKQSLFEMSATTEWDVRQAELDENISRIQLKQKQSELKSLEKSTRKKIESLEIEVRLLQLDLASAEDKLKKATVSSELEGVLTWIADEEGASVRAGDPIARVADLSRFRVEASVSDHHSGRLSVGMPVYVKVGNEKLDGNIYSIPPKIENGQMTLIISLDQPDYHLLRSNMRTDVYIVTSRKDDVLRVQKGPFISSPGLQEVFVLSNREATRREAEIGISGIEFYEIVNGLTEGEEVVISNMDDYLHLEKVSLR